VTKLSYSWAELELSVYTYQEDVKNCSLYTKSFTN